jgi:hypothetical protein
MVGTTAVAVAATAGAAQEKAIPIKIGALHNTSRLPPNAILPDLPVRLIDKLDFIRPDSLAASAADSLLALLALAR